MQDRLPPDRRTSCNARPDHTSVSIAIESGLSGHVRYSPGSHRIADIPDRQLRTKGGSGTSLSQQTIRYDTYGITPSAVERSRARTRGDPGRAASSRSFEISRRCHVPVLDDPQGEIPCTVDAGEQEQRDRTRETVRREGFLGNYPDRARDQI